MPLPVLLQYDLIVSPIKDPLFMAPEGTLGLSSGFDAHTSVGLRLPTSVVLCDQRYFICIGFFMIDSRYYHSR